MTLLSPNLGEAFRREGGDYRRYLTFKGVPPRDAEQWKASLLLFAKKLTFYYKKTLLLKSPPHTARVRLLLELFPDARFVHVHRNPYDVFLSTRHMMEAVAPTWRLQDPGPGDFTDHILANYREMYDAYFESRGLIPRGRLHEVRYEDLVHDPEGHSGRSTGRRHPGLRVGLRAVTGVPLVGLRPGPHGLPRATRAAPRPDQPGVGVLASRSGAIPVRPSG